MRKADLPPNETARLAALHGYQILDTLPEDCFDDITLLAAEICATPISLVSLVDRDRQWFKSRRGLDVAETSRDLAFCGHAILAPDELLIVPDARVDDRFADSPLVTDDPQIRFYAGAPLVTKHGEALGTLCVIDRVRRTLNDGQAGSLRALSRQVMAQLELRRHVFALQQHKLALESAKKELERSNLRLEETSLRDDVSGFRNTRFLHVHLDRLLSEAPAREKVSLAFFDMDRFKRVVDTHGHLLGSKVLREVAEVVNRHLRSEDEIIRYGGDEFIVILPGQDASRARDTVERLRESISTHAFLTEHGLDVRVTASFGLSTYPDDASDKLELLAHADDGLFRSKALGRNRVTLPPGTANS